MTSISHEPAIGRNSGPWQKFLKIPEMWASLGISMMWIAVMIDAAFGPNFVSNDRDDDPFCRLRRILHVAGVGLGRPLRPSRRN